jgi:hypothetical protein
MAKKKKRRRRPGPAEPMKVLSIDEEFAELEAELERITALPIAGGGEANQAFQALDQLRRKWLERTAARADAEGWKARVERACAEAFDRLLRLAHGIDAEGNLRFDLNQKSLGKHAGPLVGTAVESLADDFLKRWAPKDAAPAETPRQVGPEDVAGLLAAILRPRPKK